MVSADVSLTNAQIVLEIKSAVALLHASKENGVELGAEKTKCMLIYCHSSG
jgi:hypothetical protein